jgi:hypothetical protein
MEELSNHTTVSGQRFTLQPQVRWKINLFKTVFLLSCLVMWYSIHKFTSDFSNDKYFVNLALISLFSSVLSVVIASILIRCPRCGKRIYTPLLMWRNKMPDHKKHSCPFCNFPKEDQVNTNTAP